MLYHEELAGYFCIQIEEEITAIVDKWLNFAFQQSSNAVFLTMLSETNFRQFVVYHFCRA